MSSRVGAFTTVCLACVVAFGCGGEPPAKEIEQAQNAIDAAVSAGAELYAVDEFAAARLALTNAKTAVDQRDYRLALNDALDSRERALNAAKEAADTKSAARSAAERALKDADAAIDGARGKLQAAEDRKLSVRVLSGPRNAIDTAAVSLQEARTAFDQGRYLEVPTKAVAATALLASPLAQLDTAMSAPTRRRR